MVLHFQLDVMVALSGEFYSFSRKEGWNEGWKEGWNEGGEKGERKRKAGARVLGGPLVNIWISSTRTCTQYGLRG